jgi:ABC-type iron transport system FetAB ATPase subunit
MSDTQQPWKRINDKLQQVLQQYQVLQKDNDRLTKELKELKAKDALQARKIEELEIKIAALKTATGQLDEADKKELDKRLHQYIREIDRCIAMLSQ